MTNWLKSSPRRLTLVGSKVRRSTSDIEAHRLGIVAPAMTAMPTVRTAMAASVHQVERTLRSLIHSERNTLAALRRPPAAVGSPELGPEMAVLVIVIAPTFLMRMRRREGSHWTARPTRHGIRRCPASSP